MLKIASAHKTESRLKLRASVILKCNEGLTNKEIAGIFNLRENTVGDIRNRFLAEKKITPIQRLADRPRKGRNPLYGKDFGKTLLKKIGEEPPNGHSRWDGGLLAQALGVKPGIVWKILRKEGIQLKRKRSWCISTDPHFAEKSADVIGLYLNPPFNAVVLCVDEKPSVQAIERKAGYIECGSVTHRAYQSTYRRHGTLNLFSALDVRTGEIISEVTESKKRENFLKFMGKCVRDYPGKDIHVVLDNYCTHKKRDVFLDANPGVKFHFTPTAASWLNQVEIFFGIFTRKVLDGASFESKKNLKEKIELWIEYYNANKARPFKWRRREVKGSQIKNNIDNLKN